MITIILFLSLVMIPFLGFMFSAVVTIIAVVLGAIGGTVVAITDIKAGRKYDSYGYDGIEFIDCFEEQKKQKTPMFTDEEILVTGLYPKDELYEAFLISNILNK